MNELLHRGNLSAPVLLKAHTMLSFKKPHYQLACVPSHN